MLAFQLKIAKDSMPAGSKQESEKKKEGHIIEIKTKKELDSFLSSSNHAVLIFSMRSCAWCPKMKKTMQEFAQDYVLKGKDVKFGEINGTNSPELAKKYSVEAYPTVILFEKGEEKDRVVGIRPKLWLDLSFMP